MERRDKSNLKQPDVLPAAVGTVTELNFISRTAFPQAEIIGHHAGHGQILQIGHSSVQTIAKRDGFGLAQMF